jgi:hypothetical protein
LIRNRQMNSAAAREGASELPPDETTNCWTDREPLSPRSLADPKGGDVSRVDADRTVGAVLVEPRETGLGRSSGIRELFLDLVESPVHSEDVTVQEPDLRVGHRSQC